MATPRRGLRDHAPRLVAPGTALLTQTDLASFGFRFVAFLLAHGHARKAAAYLFAVLAIEPPDQGTATATTLDNSSPLPLLSFSLAWISDTLRPLLLLNSSGQSHWRVTRRACPSSRRARSTTPSSAARRPSGKTRQPSER
ncbi:hypothetical protein OsI_02670 [Oryza sativa Indica Group]|uniref:Uncharacterized protein n=1 Tax=Oryza sativa subsp. indica TaxID=39946 RepID=B8AB48_ORYSI|nr:hypothetical protein OsI_02670 [Oryza sativa Indica Group]